MEYEKIRKTQYQNLAGVFEDWYFDKLKSIEANKNLDKPPFELLERLNLDEDSFYKKYIDPYKNISRTDIDTIFKILATELTEIYEKSNDILFNCELKIHYDLTTERKINALAWVLFQIYLLGIFDFPKNLKKYLEIPYHQCNYCGKPNFYIIKNKQVSLSQKEKFCHNDNCQKGSNPNLHDDCCYAKWVLKRKTLEKRLRLLKTEINKNQLDAMLLKAKLSGSRGINDINCIKKEKEELEQKIKRAFIVFCEKQFEENLKINYKIRSKRKKHLEPINLVEYNL